MTERFVKIATIENEIESLRLREQLQQRGIPHGIQSYHDTAYDGLFQVARGWGHVEAPAEHAAAIVEILDRLRDQAAGRSEREGQGEP